MNRLIIFLLLISFVAKADDIKSVKVGEIEIKIPNPPGMVELPANDPYQAMFKVMIPPGSTALKENVTPEMLQNRDQVTSTPAFMAATIAPAVALTQNEDDSAFESLVQKVKQKFSDGTTIVDADAPHYEEIKKKIAVAMQKTGETVTAKQGTESFGPISKGNEYISLLFTRRYTIRPKDTDIPQQSYMTMTYLHVNQKLIIVMIVRSNDTLGDKDLDILKSTTEQYVSSLLASNKK